MIIRCTHLHLRFPFFTSLPFESSLEAEMENVTFDKESNHRILPQKLGIRGKELSMPDPWLRMEEWRLIDLNFKEDSIDADEIRRPIFHRRKSSYSDPSSSSSSSSSSSTSSSDEEFVLQEKPNIKVSNDQETASGICMEKFSFFGLYWPFQRLFSCCLF